MGFRDLAGLQRRYAGEAGRLAREFYSPVLGRAIRYDRQAGFFDSATLVQVAAGLAAFLRRTATTLPTMGAGPAPMRLVTGASWNGADVIAFQRGHEELVRSLGDSLLRWLEPTDEECLRLGLPPGWRPEGDQIARHQLGTLAWMVARRLLEVRIALPLDHLGRPYLPGRQGALYHPKAGILYDGEGNLLSFQGSINETGAAWARNREKFEVKRSWYSAQDAEDIQAEIEEFERIWAGREPGLLVLPLPKAVERRLVELAPSEPPRHDALEEGSGGRGALAERLAAQFLLDAPRMAGGEQLVLDPLLLNPYPHQARVARRVVREFPRRFLFCDEVGLGKTIEAGLALRALMLRGDLKRVLVIVPRGLVRQWQEELREKFGLTAWFYDGQWLVDVGGRTREPGAAVWEEDGILLVSRHYIARQARRDQVLGVRRPWDAVLVDEAHAARRRVFDRSQPNLLLSLLLEMHRCALYRCLWLLTATPMQLDPMEVHDLLRLCGVENPPWGEWASERRFVGFFLDLRAFKDHREVRPGVVAMSQKAVALGAQPLDPSEPAPEWEAFPWRSFAEKIDHHRPGLGLELNRLTGRQAEGLTALLARQTPLAVHMFRHTRSTLRAYQERGLLSGPVPHRSPEDVPVTFAGHREQELYDRIDVLCSRFYRLADLPPQERSGVGFLMAVFRKRLASSFASFRKSLERRRDFILQVQDEELDKRLWAELEAEAAEAEEEGEEAAIEGLVEAERQRLRRLRGERLEAELEYLRDYLADLEQIHHDSKFAAFRGQLDRLLAEGHRVIVFTQYLDTMYFLRDQLVPRFADGIVCYSGWGGEVWDPAANQWRVVEKAEVKARCRRDHPRAARLLLGTDAASEGLNLQQFSALVNYDLPWNPMRVEQRIGRIDRIGQESSRVKVVNLYLNGSIEQDTYNVLRERIGFFEDVVGPLQPILAEVPRLFRAVARGEMERAEALRHLRESAGREHGAPIQALEEYAMADSGESDGRTAPPAPATQEQLAAWCLQHPAPGMRLAVCPEPGAVEVATDSPRGCLRLAWPEAPVHLGIGPAEELLVTFNAEVADRHPPTPPEEDEEGLVRPASEGVRLLTWGDPLLESWLEAVRGEPLSPEELAALGWTRSDSPVGYRPIHQRDGESVRLGQLLGLLRAQQGR